MIRPIPCEHTLGQPSWPVRYPYSRRNNPHPTCNRRKERGKKRKSENKLRKHNMERKGKSKFIFLNKNRTIRNDEQYEIWFTYVVRLTIWVWILVTPSGSSKGLMHSVAPNKVAISNFALFISMAKIRLAFLVLAAWIAARPTAPSPNTATVAPSCTLHVFHTAPKPVLNVLKKKKWKGNLSDRTKRWKYQLNIDSSFYPRHV